MIHLLYILFKDFLFTCSDLELFIFWKIKKEGAGTKHLLKNSLVVEWYMIENAAKRLLVFEQKTWVRLALLINKCTSSLEKYSVFMNGFVISMATIFFYTVWAEVKFSLTSCSTSVTAVRGYWNCHLFWRAWNLCVEKKDKDPLSFFMV